jgi:tRNA G37 N-methylase TrmD
MHIDILTLFPEMFPGYLNESILKRAQAAGLLHIASAQHPRLRHRQTPHHRRAALRRRRRHGAEAGTDFYGR